MSTLPTIPSNVAIQKVTRRSHKRPRLYAIATKPTTAGQSSTAEWSLDLYIPPVPTTDSGYISQDEFLPSSSANPSSPPSVASSTTGALEEEEQNYHFTRFNPTSYSQDSPANVIARISLSSVPSGAESPLEAIEIIHSIVDALESVYLTPDSASWLRQALFALQKAEILPPVTSGFAVNNFMAFATSHLEACVKDLPADESSVKEIKYSKVLRDHERARRTTVGSEVAPRNIPVPASSSSSPTSVPFSTTVAAGSHDDLDNDEYEWSLPYRGKQSRDGAMFSGFRSATASGPGSNASSRSSSRARGVSEPYQSVYQSSYQYQYPGQIGPQQWKTRDVYAGGLLGSVA